MHHNVFSQLYTILPSLPRLEPVFLPWLPFGPGIPQYGVGGGGGPNDGCPLGQIYTIAIGLTYLEKKIKKSPIIIIKAKIIVNLACHHHSPGLVHHSHMHSLEKKFVIIRIEYQLYLLCENVWCILFLIKLFSITWQNNNTYHKRAQSNK